MWLHLMFQSLVQSVFVSFKTYCSIGATGLQFKMK
jgi:hypothetical protein